MVILLSGARNRFQVKAVGRSGGRTGGGKGGEVKAVMLKSGHIGDGSDAHESGAVAIWLNNGKF